MNYLNIEGLDALWERVKAGILSVRELADSHTELINKVEDTAGTALQTAQLAQNVGNEALDGIETLTSEIAGLKTRIEALEAKVDTNQSADNA